MIKSTIYNIRLVMIMMIGLTTHLTTG